MGPTGGKRGEGRNPAKSSRRGRAGNPAPTRARNTCVAVRGDRSKYVLWRRDGKPERQQFFDLEADPWEVRNRVADPDCKAAVEELKQALAEWEASTETSPAQPMLERTARRGQEED